MRSLGSLKGVVGRLIREERTQKGWKQQQLADATDLKRTTISNIESGRQSLSLEQFCSIVDVLGKDAAEVLKVALRHLTSEERHDKVQQVVASSESEEVIQKHVLDALK
jgi:transcriptional regulator with XRE-family HTH domain